MATMNPSMDEALTIAIAKRDAYKRIATELVNAILSDTADYELAGKALAELEELN